MERRGETWRKTQKERGSCVAIQRPIMDFSLEVASVRAFTHPLGSWHSGINVPPQGSGGNAAPPEPMHQDPSGSFSGNCGVQAQLHFPRPRCLGPNPCPLTCGRPLPGGGAPGPSLGGRGHCRAAFGCWGAAPPGARPTTGGKRRERARAAGPSLPASLPQESLFPARVVYDLLFFFIVIIIVLNLIFGVIIDTFADLRSEKQKKEEILKTTCFICGEAGPPPGGRGRQQPQSALPLSCGPREPCPGPAAW